MNYDGRSVKGNGTEKGPSTLFNAVSSAAATAAAVVNETRSARGAIDGRKKRWDEHKRARREEFLDGALRAIRREGPNIGMEAVAAELRVSKTVLYRHFTDKSDLIGAILTKIAQTVLLPPLLAELAQERDDFEQARGMIGAYVNSIAAEPSLYSFVFAHNQEVGGQESVVATSERVVAEALSALVGGRLRTMSAEALVDYLTMLVWGGLEGVIHAQGSPVKFAPAATTEPGLRLLGQPATPELNEDHDD